MGLDAQSADPSSSTLATDKPRSATDKKGKLRKGDLPDDAPIPEKKPRKKWTQEETMMLVNGCQIVRSSFPRRHFNKTLRSIMIARRRKLEDHLTGSNSQIPGSHRSGSQRQVRVSCLRRPTDTAHSFSRFRTYFPDAYKKHYPNAKTHLSNKIRSTFPDGTSLFEKTRSKRRRPFTEAEDAALKAGYEKHGTTWATIVKDPIFQEQNRRSTDLRDRFRNAFPHLYQAAGYKPRAAVKKRTDGPVRAADDNLAQISTTGPVRSRRRAQSRTGFLRGGTKSVPQSTACSEDEDSSAGEEDEESSPFKVPATPVLKDITALPTSPLMKDSPPRTNVSTPASSASAPTPASVVSASNDSYMQADVGMDMVTIDADIPDFVQNDPHSDIEAWSSGVNTPTHSSTAAWSIAGASPTTSHLSDFLLNATANTSNSASNVSSPFIHRRNDSLGNNMIGKSAWGHDWFLPNPRLDSSSAGSNPSYIDNSFSPASPFSFHPHLNHGVLDRYDLFPPSMPHDISSDAGLGDSHTTFSDDHNPAGAAGASAGGTGFRGYHSQIAGDLISGAGSRMQAFSPLTGSNLYGSFTGSGNEILGLGLEGIPEDAGIHPMQLDASYSAIDELGLTGISLNDNLDSSSHNTISAGQHRGDAMDDGTSDDSLSNYGLRSPNNHQSQRREENEPDRSESALLSDPFNLEDLVDMSNGLQHETPPATPVMAHSRPLRRSSQGSVLHSFDSPGNGSHHARSISVPPSEARNGGGGGMNVGGPLSMDDVVVGLQIHSQLHGQQQTHPNSPPPEMTLGKGLQSLFGIHTPLSSRPSSANRSQRTGRSPEPMRSSNSGAGLFRQSSAMSSPQLQPQHHHQIQQTTQPATLFPAQLMSAITPASTPSHNQSSNHNVPHTQGNDFWRVPSSASPSGTQTWSNSNSITSSDFYNVPYLDLHYTYGGVGMGPSNITPGFNDPQASDTSQGQEALDLAQPASSSLNLTNLGLNLAFGTGNNTKAQNVSSSPTSTIRMHHLPAAMTLNKQSQPPSDTFGSVAAAIAAANAVGQNGSNNTTRESSISGVNALDLSGSGTIRQSHFRSANPGLGRSMSHHRGQSAVVCPQDLDLSLNNDGIKRKRLSWDGGLV